ncbi:hypothetical protein R83H12_00799 [Fibrobacteria bacterium R8-3-H12]
MLELLGVSSLDEDSAAELELCAELELEDELLGVSSLDEDSTAKLELDTELEDDSSASLLDDRTELLLDSAELELWAEEDDSSASLLDGRTELLLGKSIELLLVAIGASELELGITEELELFFQFGSGSTTDQSYQICPFCIARDMPTSGAYSTMILY